MFACCHRRAPTSAALAASSSAHQTVSRRIGHEPNAQWQQAVRKVVDLLNLRKLFAQLGRYLQERQWDEEETETTRRIQDVWADLGHKLNNVKTKKLFNHVERRRGILHYKKVPV